MNLPPRESAAQISALARAGLIAVTLALSSCAALSTGKTYDTSKFYVDMEPGNRITISRQELRSGKYKCWTDRTVLYCTTAVGVDFTCSCVGR